MIFRAQLLPMPGCIYSSIFAFLPIVNELVSRFCFRSFCGYFTELLLVLYVNFISVIFLNFSYPKQF